MVTIKEDLTLLVKDMLEERLENHVKSNDELKAIFSNILDKKLKDFQESIDGKLKIVESKYDDKIKTLEPIR